MTFWTGHIPDSFFFSSVRGWDAEEEEVVACTPNVRQAIKGPATLNGGEQCWCPDKSTPVN